MVSNIPRNGCRFSGTGKVLGIKQLAFGARINICLSGTKKVVDKK